jgi:hypothetical protein
MMVQSYVHAKSFIVRMRSCLYRIAPNFRGSKILEIAKNPMNENFRDKNFVIATIFRDYRRVAARVRTIYVVAPPTIARGSRFARLG